MKFNFGYNQAARLESKQSESTKTSIISVNIIVYVQVKQEISIFLWIKKWINYGDGQAARLASKQSESTMWL